MEILKNISKASISGTQLRNSLFNMLASAWSIKNIFTRRERKENFQRFSFLIKFFSTFFPETVT